MAWRRRPIRQSILLLLFLVAITAVFLARSGFPPGNRGYSDALHASIRSTFSTGDLSAQDVSAIEAAQRARFWATIIVTLENSVVRVTTLLPWVLALLAVRRVRRMRLWDPLRVSRLTPREWVAGLAGPPIVLATLALVVFLAGVILPDYLQRFPDLPSPRREQYRAALAATIPLIGFEGAANGVVVAGITLLACMRSGRLSGAAGRSFFWVFVFEIAHTFAIYGAIRLGIWLMPAQSSAPVALFVSHSVPLVVVGGGKVALGIVLFQGLVRRFEVRFPPAAEEPG